MAERDKNLPSEALITTKDLLIFAKIENLFFF
jgi:hypothetical protein